MTDTNPYAPPKAATDVVVEKSENMVRLARGQKLVLYAIVLYLCTIPMQSALGSAGQLLAGAVVIAALIMSVLGIMRMVAALGFGTLLAILVVVLQLVPLVNLVTLLVLNSKATARLRQAGYQVGLLGAKLGLDGRPQARGHQGL